MHGPRFLLDHRFTQRHADALLDGELDADGRRRAEEHAAVCPVCRRLLDELRALLRGLRALADAPADPATEAVATAVMTRVRRE